MVLTEQQGLPAPLVPQGPRARLDRPGQLVLLVRMARTVQTGRMVQTAQQAQPGQLVLRGLVH